MPIDNRCFEYLGEEMATHKKLIITAADEQLIKLLLDSFNITRLKAIDQVVENKKHLIKYYTQEGNEKMVQQLKKELGEN